MVRKKIKSTDKRLDKDYMYVIYHVHNFEQTIHFTFYIIDSFVKRRISPYIWIPAFAGMTITPLTSTRYNSRHIREGGYPGGKVIF